MSYTDALWERVGHDIATRETLADLLARDDADEVLGNVAEWAMLSQACAEIMSVLEGVRH